MIRAVVFSVVLPLAAIPLNAQVAAKEDLQQFASALKTAYAALQCGEGEAARRVLSGTSESLRGTPFRLLEQLAADRDPKRSVTGKPVPKPDDRYMVAVLHPTKQCVAYVCDHGVVVVYDLSDANAKPERIVSSRHKPLMYGSFSGDGKSFAAGDSEGGITVWDTQTWKEAATYVKGMQPVRYVSLDKDGGKLLAETEDGVVLWDIRDNKEIGVLAAPVTILVRPFPSVMTRLIVLLVACIACKFMT